MKREPWLHFWNNQSLERKESLMTALSALGVRLRAMEPIDTAGAGLLCFESIDNDLLQFLAEATRYGFARVIAIRVSSTPLPSAAAWSMMRAGASDVLEGKSVYELAEQIRARLDRWRAIDELLELAACFRKPRRRQPLLAINSPSDCGGRTVYRRLRVAHRRKRNGQGVACASHSRHLIGKERRIAQRARLHDGCSRTRRQRVFWT